MNWKNIEKEKPNDGERVLIWNAVWNIVTIQTWNENYQCWDTDDGDDFEWETDLCKYWMELPSSPNEH